MFAGPLANFLLSIFIFTAIFLNTIDPQTVPVIESTNQNISYSTNEAFEVGDKILSINSASVKDAKDINLELLSYAGFSGELNFSVLRPNSENLTNIIVNVTDFLPSSESQSDPTNYLGLDISYLMQPIIGKVIANGSADKAGLKSNDKVLKIGNKNINFANEIREEISENPNTSIEFKINRNQEIIYIPVNIGSEDNGEKIIGVLGVSFGTSRTFLESFLKGSYETYNLSLKTLQFLSLIHISEPTRPY